MICRSCNFQNDDSVKFCVNCGIKIENEQMSAENETVYEYEPYEGSETEEGSYRKTGKGPIIVLSVLLVIAIAVLIILIVAISNGSDSSSEKTGGDTKTQGTTVSEKNGNSEEEPEKPEKKFERYVTYSSALTYRDMPDIHYSSRSSDEVCFEMEDFINKFNDSWISYVNEGDKAVFDYLRYGTKAYQNAENHGNRDIRESYIAIEVNDVREYDGYYYVWVYEKMDKYTPKDGSRTITYNWVYKIGKDSVGYYVENYRSDPYYN